MKHINELGILAVDTRMRRLCDQLVKDGRDVYLAHDLDFDPRWLAIVYALRESDGITVTNLAQILGLAHPTIVQHLNELEKKGLVVSHKSDEDGRKRIVVLSKVALKILPRLEEIWLNMRAVLEDINPSQGSSFWEHFCQFESSLERRSFADRVNEESQSQSGHIDIPDKNHPGQWFERQFDFRHLEGTATILLERLRFTPLRLSERIKWMSRNQLTAKPQNRWSIQENVGHLLDLEPLWIGRIEDMTRNLKTMRSADLENTRTHQAAHNEMSIDTLIGNFTARRNELLTALELNLPAAETLSANHPRLKKPMRMIDLMYFVAEHDDHHLATITFILSRI